MAPTKTPHYLFHRERWSQNQFSWFYGGVIFLASIIFGLVLYLMGIYESTPYRAVNGAFVIAAMLILIWDYSRVKENPPLLVDGILMCLKAGFYYCIMIIPTIILFYSLNQTDLAIAKATETHNSSMTILEIALTSGFEYMAAAALFGLFAATTSTRKKISQAQN